MGAGSIARLGHIPGLQKVGGVEVVALCDRAEDRAGALAREMGIPRVYANFTEMVGKEDLDAVTLGVPNALHAPMAIEALEAGLHVFCEKPLAISTEEGGAMLAAAQRSGRTLAMNMQQRTRPEYAGVRRLFAEGSLGEVRYVNARWFRRSGIPGFGSWFTRRELAGGGVLMDIGVHMLDVALWMLGFPEVSAVRGEVQSVHGPRGRGLGGWGAERHTAGVFDVEDFASLHLRLKNGGLVTIEVSWATFGQDEMRVQVLGSEAGVDIDGEKYGGKAPVRIFHENPAEDVPLKLPKRPPGTDWDHTTADFVSSIREGRAPLAPAREGLEMLRILQAGYTSAREGREVVL